MDLLPNPIIESERDSTVKDICVIGTGPSGLGALKIIADSPQYKAGLWRPVAFEAREEIGGVWVPAPPTDNPPLTPLYDSLTTNLPHPLMAYPSFPFPPSTLLYPPASTVLKYLQSYASHFDINQHIRVNTSVRSVDWDKELSRWRVRTSPTSSGADAPTGESLFDLVVVANGHYRVPRYPDIPGLDVWLAIGKTSHAAWYRHARDIGDTILVVGGGPSGLDIADEMLAVSRTVVHSIPGTKRADRGSLKLRGRITAFADVTEGRVVFEDGTSESGIDHCILATGYEHSLPFLPGTLLQQSLPPPIPPIPETLYNSTYHIFPLAKQMFPLVTSFPTSSLAFVVLQYRIIPFALVETQMRAVLKAFAVPESIDSANEAVDIVSRYEELRKQVGDDERVIARAWHKLEGEEQFQYQDELHKYVGGEYAGPEWKVPDWYREVWEYKFKLRDEWKELVTIGEAERWVQGVGEAGGAEGTKEWLELMRRVIRRAEDRQAAPSSQRGAKL